MKISEMTNDQATEALIRLAVPFGNICEDEEAVKMIDQYTKLKRQPLIQVIGKLLPQVSAYLLKTHKNDLYEIVGALTFKPRTAVAKMNFFDTIKVFKDSYDEVLQGFFTSSVQQMSEIAAERSQTSSNTATTD